MVKNVNGVYFACVWDKWYYLDNRSKWIGPFETQQKASEATVVNATV